MAGNAGHRKKLTAALAFFQAYSADELAFLESQRKREWLDRPVPQNIFLWNAFLTLRRSRNMDGRIPFSEIDRFADRAGIACPVQFHRLMTVMAALDDVR